MFTMCPRRCASIGGSAARVKRNTPVRLTSSSRRHSAAGISWVAPRHPTPALFTTASRRPPHSRARATAAAAVASSVTSPGTAVARGSPIASTARTRSSFVRATSTTRAPASARSAATARARHDDHLPRELRGHPPPPPIPPAGACTGDARSQGPVPCTVESVPVNRRILAALSYGHFATDLSQGAIPALLPVFKALFHLSYAGVGFIVLMANISSSVIQPAFGVLSDRIGMRWLMPVGALLAGVGMTLAVLSPHYALTIFLILISGLGVAAFHPDRK